MLSRLIVSIMSLFLCANIAHATVYLEYNAAKTDGGVTGVLNVYQPIENAPSAASVTNRKWIQHKIYQYTGGGGSWDNSGNIIGNIATTTTYTYATSSVAWTWTNGTGGATWAANIPVTGYGFQRFVAPSTGYTDYSAYGQITLSQDAETLLLGYWYNPTVNGVIRVLINGVVQANVGALDANGEFDTSTFTNANSELSGNVYSIPIGSRVRSGDVVTVQAKTYNGTKSRIYIYGIKYANYTNVVPGTTNWQFIDRHQFEAAGITTTVAATFAPVGDSGSFSSFSTGPAHPNHENNGSTTAISVGGTSYTLGSNLNVGDVVSGETAQIIAGNNVYGTSSTTDSFADITRTFDWASNGLTRAWSIAFKRNTTASFFYIVMNSPNSTGATTTRYWGIGSTTNILMPTDGTQTGQNILTPLEDSTHLSLFGGDIGVKVSIASRESGYGFQSGASSNKIYLRKQSWERLWTVGESVSNSSVINYSYEPPENINWSGETLMVAKDHTISTATSSLPFRGAGAYIKIYPAKSLTFTGFAPIKTYFSSLKDATVGTSMGSLSLSPAKGDWVGVTISGAVDAANNIIKHSTTALTLTSNANAYHNTIYNNTTGISAASGSNAKNNILNSNTTSTTGSGTFDYNAYSGNVETHGVNAEVGFPATGTSTVNTGVDVGITTDNLSNPRYGDHDIGAYEYQPPFTLGSSLIDPSGDIRIYGDRKYQYITATSTSMSADFSVAPAEGSWTFASTTARSEWLTVSDFTWNTSDTYSKQWTASSSVATTTIYTIGNLLANTSYNVKVDGTASTSISGDSCTDGVCVSNGDGQVVFTYSGGYSTHTFNIDAYTAPETSEPRNRSSGGGYKIRYNPILGQVSTTTSSTTNPVSSAHVFTRDLQFRSTGDDVKLLQKFLNTHGFMVAAQGPGSLGHETNFFGALTKVALIRFQNSQKDYILKPLGLTSGTGFFGDATRRYIREHF